MHSSRMRTGRSLTVCRGVLLLGGCLLLVGGGCLLLVGGGSASRGVFASRVVSASGGGVCLLLGVGVCLLPGAVCLQGGSVCFWGCLLPGGVSCFQGVSASRGMCVCFLGGCLLLGGSVCLWGRCLPLVLGQCVYPSMQWGRHPPPPWKE